MNAAAAPLVALVMAVVAGTAANAAPAPATPAPAAQPAAQPAPPSQPTQLDAYLSNLKTLRASFLQTLSDSQGKEIDRATGKIIVQRPGKFSWEIHPEAAGDGAAPAKGGGAASAGQLMVC